MIQRTSLLDSVLTAACLAIVLAAVPGAALAQSSANTPPTSAAHGNGKNNQCPRFPGANQFVRFIDNPYLPLEPGTTFTYRETVDGKVQNDVVEVTSATKVIMGVRTVVVHDTASLPNGSPVEITTDWYAQDKAGNVWYFGEDTKEYKKGKVVSTKGSWQAGVRGAKPGIIMKANPRVGDRYSQECAPGEAEDMAAVRNRSTSATVPYGSFDHALLTQDTTPLDLSLVERKQYAACVGLVRSELVKGGREVLELIDVQRTSGRSGPTCDRSATDKLTAAKRAKP